MIVTEIKTKADVAKILALKEIKLLAAIEVSNDADAKEAAAKLGTLLRQKKKLHILIVGRQRPDSSR